MLPSCVRSISVRRNLVSLKQQLAALERHVFRIGEVLTETQGATLERKQNYYAACGEVETAYPGYLGSQSTF